MRFVAFFLSNVMNSNLFYLAEVPPARSARESVGHVVATRIRSRKKRAEAVSASKVDKFFTAAQRVELTDWIDDNAKKPGQARLVYRDIRKHILSTYNAKVNFYFVLYVACSYCMQIPLSSIKPLLTSLDRTYARTKNGYYYHKSIAPATIQHRAQLLPLLEYLEEHPHFTVLYHDESQFRIHADGPKYHIQPIDKKDMAEEDRAKQYDDGVSNGQPGQGYSVCTVISIEDRCIVHLSDGTCAGWVEDAQVTAKDDHHSFLLSVRQAFEAQQRLHPNQVVVLIVDGAKTHTTLPGGRNASGMNLKKGANNLMELLLSVGKWKDGMSKAKAMELWASLEESHARWSEAEEIAEELGGLLLYLPNAHPYINPIEMLWRAMKVKTCYFILFYPSDIFVRFFGAQLSNGTWPRSMMRLLAICELLKMNFMRALSATIISLLRPGDFCSIIPGNRVRLKTMSCPRNTRLKTLCQQERFEISLVCHHLKTPALMMNLIWKCCNDFVIT